MGFVFDVDDTEFVGENTSFETDTLVSWETDSTRQVCTYDVSLDPDGSVWVAGFNHVFHMEPR